MKFWGNVFFISKIDDVMDILTSITTPILPMITALIYRPLKSIVTPILETIKPTSSLAKR